MIPVNVSPSYLFDLTRADKKTCLPPGLVCFCRFLKRAILILLLLTLIFVVVAVSLYLVYCGMHNLMIWLDDLLGAVCKGKEKSLLFEGVKKKICNNPSFVDRHFIGDECCEHIRNKTCLDVYLPSSEVEARCRYLDTFVPFVDNCLKDIRQSHFFEMTKEFYLSYPRNCRKNYW